MPRRPELWKRLLTRRDLGWSLLMVVGFGFIAGLLAVSGRSMFPYEEGQVAHQTIVSRVTFTAVDIEKTQQARMLEKQTAPAVYVPNDNLFRAMREGLHELGRLAADLTIHSFDDIKPEVRNRMMLNREVFDAVRELVAAEGVQRWDSYVDDTVMKAVYSVYFLTDADANRELNKSDKRRGIMVLRDGQSALVEEWKLRSIKADEQQRSKLLDEVQETLERWISPVAIRNYVAKQLVNVRQPTYTLDPVATEEFRRAAAEAVMDTPIRKMPGDVLVLAGKRITPHDMHLLREERAAYRDAQPAVARILTPLGFFGLMLSIGLGLWVYFLRYAPRVVGNPTRAAVVFTLLIAGQCVALLMTGISASYMLVNLTFPALFIGVLIAIVYDQRFALAVGAAGALIITLSLNVPPAAALVTLCGIGVAIAQLDEIRNRSKLVWTGVWSGLAMAAVFWMCAQLIQPWLIDGQLSVTEQLQLLLKDSGLLFFTGAGTCIIVLAALPAIESTFNVTTSMTLKELNDASHPLLQRLAQDAPGTYQHSLRLADISEAGATAIGANGLLCRVGAMYHDIGKMNKPSYFVENQGGGPNRHDKLSPAMSVLIIVGHVKDGIEMAREYRLPRPIQHFIESHHGTTLVEYFFQEARKKSEADDTPTPTEFEFRYPGPKPQTTEAAIMMLCDAIESAARTLPEPTPVRLEQLVRNMANKRLMDGQFDECNLTLKELHSACEAIHKTLCAVYHNRIAYPKDDVKPAGDVEKPAASAS